MLIHTNKCRVRSVKVRQGRTEQIRAEQSRTEQDKTELDRTGQGRTGQGRTEQDMAGRGRAMLGKAGQCRAVQDRTGQGRARAQENTLGSVCFGIRTYVIPECTSRECWYVIGCINYHCAVCSYDFMMSCICGKTLACFISLKVSFHATSGNQSFEIAMWVRK